MLAALSIIPFSIEMNVLGAWISTTDAFVFGIFLAWIWTVSASHAAIKELRFPLLPFVAGFLAVYAASSAVSLDGLLSLKDILKMLSVFLLFYMIVNNCSDEPFLRFLPVLITAAVSLVSLMFIYDFVAQKVVIDSGYRLWDKPFSPFRQLNSLGAIFVLSIPFGAYCYFSSASLRNRILYMLAFFAQAAALLLTFSRSNWIAFIIILGMIAYYKKKVAGVIVYIVVLAAALAVISVSMPGRGFRDLFIIRQDPKNYSILDRRLHILSAEVLIKMRPGLGVGAGNFRIGAKKYLNHNVTDTAHNIFLQYGAEAGVGAMLLLAVLFAAYARSCFLVHKALAKGSFEEQLLVFSCISFAGLFVYAQFGDLFVKGTKEYTALLLAMPYLLERYASRGNNVGTEQ